MVIDIQPIHILAVVIIVGIVYFLSTHKCKHNNNSPQGMQIRIMRPDGMIPLQQQYYQKITDTPLVVNAPNGQSGTLIPVTSTDSNVQGIVNTNGRIIAPVYAPTDQSISTLVPLTQEQFMNLVKNKPKIIKKLR